MPYPSAWVTVPALYPVEEGGGVRRRVATAHDYRDPAPPWCATGGAASVDASCRPEYPESDCGTP